MVLHENVHDLLFVAATLRLGEIHWYVLRASILMDELHSIRRKNEHGLIIGSERTALGKEVGADEIDWWVFRKETNINELRMRTQQALAATQVLKEAAAKLVGRIPATYEDLLLTLRGFAEQHTTEGETLYEYVRWLASRDSMAPKILYTFRVWGSTRMSDRQVDVSGEKPEGESRENRILTEIVLGVRRPPLYTFDRVHMELGYEIYSSDPEASGEIEVPITSVMQRCAYQIFDECATYFEFIRNSLRNILLDISKRDAQESTISNDHFWRTFIPKAAGSRTTEPQLWDFKETLPMWHTDGNEKLRQKVKFAEDVAAFANARGGVLIVGVNDHRDILGMGVDLREVENRLKFAREVIDKHVEYDRNLVTFREVLLRVNGVEKRCLVITVAQACSVVAVHDGNGNYTYPIRREAGIVKVSRDEAGRDKAHMKSDNHDFLQELTKFVRDN